MLAIPAADKATVTFSLNAPVELVIRRMLKEPAFAVLFRVMLSELLLEVAQSFSKSCTTLESIFCISEALIMAVRPAAEPVKVNFTVSLFRTYVALISILPVGPEMLTVTLTSLEALLSLPTLSTATTLYCHVPEGTLSVVVLDATFFKKEPLPGVKLADSER